MIRLTRQVAFSSGHRFWWPELSRPENEALFGPYASPYNHGHNYLLEVTVEGEIDQSHGMVVNIKVIDDLLKANVLRAYDLRSINDEVPGFEHTPPCLENLLLDLRSRIEPHLPREVRLVHLRLQEMPTLYAELVLPEAMITFTRVYEFAASHRLDAPGLASEENLRLFGKCNNPHGHGHNYLLEVTVTGQPDPRTGFLCSLDELDEAVNRLIVDRYDHRNLNCEIPELEGQNPTSEVVAQAIFQQLEGKLPAKLHRVRLHETARNIFEVSA